MNKIDQYINDPYFVTWIYNSNPQIDNYWEDFLQKHPELTLELLEIKDKFSKIKFKTEFLSDDEKLRLAARIYKSLEREQKRKIFRNKIRLTMRYAAIAIFFFAAGGLIVHLYNREEQAIEKYAKKVESSLSLNEPVLILPEGRNVVINSESSLLDYRKAGEIILDKDSIIQNNSTFNINQLVMPHGKFSKILLSDSSIVWLNAGSSIIYPSSFTEKIRKIVLFGEAYFSVAKNNNQPFIVQTTELEIKVLGTEFNVSAYPEDNLIQTVVNKGSVSIRKIGNSKDEKDIILKPNQLASFDKTTNQTEVNFVDTDFYTLWTNGLLCFENRDFNRVIKSLERYYDIHIRFNDPMIGGVKISGKLDLTQGRDEVFEYLSKVSSTTFEQVDGRYYRIK